MSNTQASPSRLMIYSGLITVQVAFGINYVVTKQLLGVFPPLVWASIRIIIASLLMFSVAIGLKRKHPPFSRDFFLPLVIYALLASVINQGSFLIGLRYTTATNSAILNTLIPVFTLLIVTVRRQEALSWQRALGFVISLAGVLSIRKLEEFSFSNKTLIGDLLTVLNCLSYAIFLSISKKFMERYDRVWCTAWIFTYGSIGLSLLSIPEWTSFHWPTFSPELLTYMFFAIFGGTVLTYFLSMWALAHTHSSSVALFVYVQPAVASLLAWLWLGQTLSSRTLLSGLLIFLGMGLALVPPSKKHLVLADQNKDRQ